MSKRNRQAKAAAPVPHPTPRQDSHTPLGDEGRGESHVLLGVESSPPRTEAFSVSPDDGRVLNPDLLGASQTPPSSDPVAEETAREHARLYPATPPPSEGSAPAPKPDSSHESMTAYRAEADDHALQLAAVKAHGETLEQTLPGAYSLALQEQQRLEHAQHSAEHLGMLEQAGSFGPLPTLIIEEAADLTPEQLALLKSGAAGQVYAVASDAKALLATGIGTDAPAMVDLLEQSRAKEALAFAHKQASALELVKHLSDTEGLTVRREPDETGHPPRFTLLHVKVDAAGLSTVNVLVPVAPWHHVQDAVERFLKSTLTPREYQ